MHFTATRNIVTGIVSSKLYIGHDVVTGISLLDFNEATSLVCTVEKNPYLEGLEINYGYLSAVQGSLTRLQ